MIDASNPIIPGRSCGTCTLCCKVLSITELKKPQGVWCVHCKPGHGCKIYPDHPTECRNFYCGYLTQAELGTEWKPDRSKIVLVAELEGNRITAYTDPQRPDAWRREPYYSELKRWAEAAAPYRGQIVAATGRHMYMILPNKDVDLGIIGDDDLIVTGERTTPFGVELDAFTIKKDDPRAQNLAPQYWG